jgi:oligopeptide/dipeptide ABC transporter ATP-binding protein
VSELLSVDRLVKRFPVKGGSVWAVSGASFAVGRGETLGLVGESGSGKTTVGRCVLRLVEPDAGTIVFKGDDITHIGDAALRRLRPKMQMVFQHPFRSLDPRMSVEAIIAEPLLLEGRLSRKQIRQKIVDVLLQVRLDESYLHLYPHQLSTGEQQRVGIGRAIATDPDFIVLDEPVSALDITIRGEILRLLKSLQNDFGFSYLYISHDLSSVEHLCHRVAVMYLSAIVETGSVEEIFHRPKHPYTKALLASYLPPDPFAARSSYVLHGEIPSAIDLPAGCFLSSRCPAAVPACAQTRQHLAGIGASREVACWRAVAGEI